MNREQFISRLDELLKDIPESERAEAIEFYREYFDDAGSENEDSVIKELGSPEEVAHNIREELAEKELVTAESVERNKEQKAEREQTYTGQNGSTNRYYDNTGSNNSPEEEREKKKKNASMILLIILACILAIPVGIPVLSAVGGTLIGLAAAFLGILLAIWIVGIVFVVVSLVLFVVAIANIFTSTIASVLLFGLSFIFFGSGLLLVLAGMKICTILIPQLFRGIAHLFNSLIYRRGQAA